MADQSVGWRDETKAEGSVGWTVDCLVETLACHYQSGVYLWCLLLRTHGHRRVVRHSAPGHCFDSRIQRSSVLKITVPRTISKLKPKLRYALFVMMEKRENLGR